jgi:hypothetical protein
MAILGKKIIPFIVTSDVTSVTLETRDQGIVVLGVNDKDSDDSADGAPLITARLLPSQAIKLARALLEVAGVTGVVRGNVQTLTFID